MYRLLCLAWGVMARRVDCVGASGDLAYPLFRMDIGRRGWAVVTSCGLDMQIR